MGNFAAGNQGFRASSGMEGGMGSGGGGFLERLRSVLGQQGQMGASPNVPSAQPMAPMQQASPELSQNPYAGYSQPWWAQHKPPTPGAQNPAKYLAAASPGSPQARRIEKRNSAFSSPASRMGMF